MDSTESGRRDVNWQAENLYLDIMMVIILRKKERKDGVFAHSGSYRVRYRFKYLTQSWIICV